MLIMRNYNNKALISMFVAKEFVIAGTMVISMFRFWLTNVYCLQVIDARLISMLDADTWDTVSEYVLIIMCLLPTGDWCSVDIDVRCPGAGIGYSGDSGDRRKGLEKTHRV